MWETPSGGSSGKKKKRTSERDVSADCHHISLESSSILLASLSTLFANSLVLMLVSPFLSIPLLISESSFSSVLVDRWMISFPGILNAFSPSTVEASGLKLWPASAAAMTKGVRHHCLDVNPAHLKLIL